MTTAIRALMPEEPNQEVEARRFPSFASPQKQTTFTSRRARDGFITFYLTPLVHLTNMGDFFLGDCSGLTALDLTPFTHLTSVGNGFLYRCAGLTVLDLAPLVHLTNMGDFFLGGCSGSTALDLTPLAHLTNVGNFFLGGCGWTKLDLTVL